MSQHTDTSKNTKAWAVSQHTDTSKNTKAWAVSRHTDWHQQEHQSLGCVTTHWHQQEYQGLGCVTIHWLWHQQEQTPRLHSNVMRCIIMWGLSSAMINVLHNSIHPPEMEINPPKTACGCFRVQELCESRGGRPGLPVLMSLMVSVDVRQHWTVLTHWSQFVPNMSTRHPRTLSSTAASASCSGAVWKSKWPFWAPVPYKPTVSVDIKQHSTKKPYHQSVPRKWNWGQSNQTDKTRQPLTMWNALVQVQLHNHTGWPTVFS